MSGIQLSLETEVFTLKVGQCIELASPGLYVALCMSEILIYADLSGSRVVSGNSRRIHVFFCMLCCMYWDMYFHRFVVFINEIFVLVIERHCNTRSLRIFRIGE